MRFSAQFYLLLFVNLSHGEESCLTVDRPDRFGAQYFAIMTAYAKAKLQGMRYCHSRIRSSSLKSSFPEVDNFIGFAPQNCTSCSVLEMRYLHHIENIGPDTLYSRDVLESLRERFFREKNKGLKENLCKYNASKTAVAVHIRRGDILQSSRHRMRVIPVSAYSRVIEDLRKLYKEPRFYIFSEGSLNGLEEISSTDVHFMLKNPSSSYSPYGPEGVRYTEEQSAFICITLADVIINSISSFSRSASMLSTGLTYSLVNRQTKMMGLPELKRWRKIPIQTFYVEPGAKGTRCENNGRCTSFPERQWKKMRKKQKRRRETKSGGNV